MIGFKEEWYRVGMIEEGRDALLILFTKKLGPMPPEIERDIRSLEDLDKIHGIVERFFEIHDWHELRQALNGAEVIPMIDFKEDARREGFQQGIERCIQMGKDTLLTLFPKKLGPVPPEIEREIRSIEDPDKIHNIVVRFLEINDWHELRQALN